jgi:hypothetical protein
METKKSDHAISLRELLEMSSPLVHVVHDELTGGKPATIEVLSHRYAVIVVDGKEDLARLGSKGWRLHIGQTSSPNPTGIRFRKKPVEVEAIQYTGEDSFFVMLDTWGEQIGSAFDHFGNGGRLCVNTLEGPVYAKIGDWIVKGIAGEFYPVKPAIFQETYEQVET